MERFDAENPLIDVEADVGRDESFCCLEACYLPQGTEEEEAGGEEERGSDSEIIAGEGFLVGWEEEEA